MSPPLAMRVMDTDTSHANSAMDEDTTHAPIATELETTSRVKQQSLFDKFAITKLNNIFTAW